MGHTARSARHSPRFTIGRVAGAPGPLQRSRQHALHHPPPLADRLTAGAFGDYVFAVTRLEANKRPDLVVGGLLAARSEVRGSWPAPARYARQLEARRSTPPVADRVELPGFVADDDLVPLLARHRLGVIYDPTTRTTAT